MKNPLELRSQGEWLWLIARETARSFVANRSLQSAATLAFYGFLSLMPLLLLVVFLFGRVLHASNTALAAVQSLAADMFPSFNEGILDDLLKLADQKVWGVVSVIVLMWSMTPFAAAVRLSLAGIFKAGQKLEFWRAKLMDFFAVLALLILFVALVALRLFFSARAAPAAFAALAPFVLSVAVLALFYAVFAPPGMRGPHLFTGAFVAAALLGVVRPLFTLLLHFNPNYGYAFGSLKAVFLLLMWVYYTFAVILFGAEVVANTRRREALVLRGLFDGNSARGTALINQFIAFFEPGSALFREGDEGAEMFVVREGEVALSQNGREIKRMGPNEYFGEMSMLIGSARTATAVAGARGARVARISERTFDTLLRENPEIVKKLLREMAQRLKATTARATTAP